LLPFPCFWAKLSVIGYGWNLYIKYRNSYKKRESPKLPG
jgi:hypothetical protein